MKKVKLVQAHGLVKSICVIFLVNAYLPGICHTRKDYFT